jgi:hypothetical protein
MKTTCFGINLGSMVCVTIESKITKTPCGWGRHGNNKLPVWRAGAVERVLG